MSMKSRRSTASVKTSLDLSLVVFDGDRDMRAALLDDPDFAAVAADYAKRPTQVSIRRDLLLTSVRLTPRIAPALFACVEECTKTLGIENDIEVYCSQEAEMNAFVVPPEKGRICIGFSNTALERFADDELRFILGHELGHTLFEHYKLGNDIVEEEPRLSPLDVMRFYAWKRYAELTCDRVGLLCCRDFSIAVRTFFKLTSGLSDPRWLANVTEAAMHYAVQEASSIEQASDVIDWYSTHPYSPLRVKALDLFAKSHTYHQLLGEKGGELSETVLETEVAHLVELMNPSVFSEKIDCKSELKEFIAVCGLAVAMADDNVDKSELKAIKQLIGRGRLVDDLDRLAKLDATSLGLRAQELAQKLTTRLSPIRCLKVVEDICGIAAADGKILQSEIDTLYGVAELLNVSLGFVDDVLSRAAKPLD
jgi:uncharacterized tellurite resistance protein B-like protein